MKYKFSVFMGYVNPRTTCIKINTPCSFYYVYFPYNVVNDSWIEEGRENQRYIEKVERHVTADRAKTARQWSDWDTLNPTMI